MIFNDIFYNIHFNTIYLFIVSYFYPRPTCRLFWKWNDFCGIYFRQRRKNRFFKKIKKSIRNRSLNTYLFSNSKPLAEISIGFKMINTDYLWYNKAGTWYLLAISKQILCDCILTNYMKVISYYNLTFYVCVYT